MHVKNNIEEIQGKDNYPWGQQSLIFNGKVLKNENTLEENKVKQGGFLVVMLTKAGCMYHPYSICFSEIFDNYETVQCDE
jgi:hypothetical protein